MANEAIGLINDQIDRVNTLADTIGADFLKIGRIAEFGPATPAASDAAVFYRGVSLVANN